MLSTSSRLRIEEILRRISNGDKVTLEERIYLNKYSTRYQNVSEWLRKASKLQRNKENLDPIDKLLDGLNLSSSEPHSTYNPNLDDLGDWFSGAPSWIRRS
tara:strand:- start:2388 stop:2690 length:303 start_codon:yes stop_codon:yes gene_type:complete